MDNQNAWYHRNVINLSCAFFSVPFYNIILSCVLIAHNYIKIYWFFKGGILVKSELSQSMFEGVHIHFDRVNTQKFLDQVSTC